MHPDDDPQTTLSKWPFILGDVLLVATALAIAILGQWQLTDWQVGACVAAVALGAALFVLPYVVEYQVRVREEREDRAADLRILEKHLLVAEQAIDSSDARIRALESAAAEADSPNAALAEAMDQKIAQLEAARAAQVEVIQALQKDVEELAAKEPPPSFDPKVLQPIEKRLKTLEDKPAPVVEASAPKKEPPPAPKKEAPEPPKPEPEKVEPKTSDSKPEQKAPKPEEPKPAPEKPEKAESPKPEKKAAPIERPQREARERHGPEESRLMKRAISEKGDKSSTAVSRIIESKVKEKKTTEAPKEPESPEPEPEKEEPAKDPEPVKKEAPKEVTPKVEKPEPEKEEPEQEEAKPKAEAKKEEPKAEPVAEKPKPASEKPEATVDDDNDNDDDNDDDSDKHLEPESKPTPKVAKKEEPTVEPEAKPEPKPAKTEEPKVEKKPESQDDAIDLDAEVPAMDSSDMLFDDAAVRSPIKKTKAKKNDAVITAAVFIGIGNKPYLRGSGGGLNWEKGQLMEFQEIGKWRWVAPSDLEAPLEIQIYRNDEDPDKSGKCTLEPGQKLEVTPVF